MQNILVARREALSKRIALARAHKISVNFAALDIVSGLSVEMSAPKLTVACGEGMDPTISFDAFCTFSGKVFIAQKLAEVWGSDSTLVNQPAIKAHCFGEISGPSPSSEIMTVARMQEARTAVLSLLRTRRPKTVFFNSVINELVKQCKNAPSGVIVPREEALEVCPNLPESTVMSAQKFRFYSVFGPTIPSTLFETNEEQAMWINLTDVAVRDAMIGDIVFTMTDEHLAEHWPVLSDQAILAFYDMAGKMRVTEMRELFVSAIIVYIMAMCKDGNMTEAWTNRRLEMVSRVIRDVNVQAHVTNDVVIEYAKYYPRTLLGADVLYERLAVVWNLMMEQNVAPLAWIIEQSAMANITTLITFAHFITKLTYVDIQYLIKQGVPRTQFQAIVELAVAVIHNPYVSIDAPPVAMNRYPDLAYIGIYGCKDLMKDLHLGDYKGAPSNRCVKSVSQLKAITSSMFTLSNEISEIEQDPLSVYMRLQAQADVQMHRERDRVFEYTIIAPGQAGGDVGGMPLDAQGAHEARENIRALRSNWPSQAKSLPANAREISGEKMREFIRTERNNETTALVTLLGEVVTHSNQVQLKPIADDSYNIPSMKRQITGTLVDAARVWGYDVPQQFRQPIPEYVGDGQRTMGVPMGSYVMTSRPIDKANDRVVARPGNAEDFGAFQGAGGEV